jgi:hypothetical protein
MERVELFINKFADFLTGWTRGNPEESRLRRYPTRQVGPYASATRLPKPLDLGRIGLPPPQCECGVIPLYYRPNGLGGQVRMPRRNIVLRQSHKGAARGF